MTRRIYVLGTDTAVGKTTVSCTLLRQARDGQETVVPYKPAQSYGPGDVRDAVRLLEAAGLDPSLEDAACGYTFDQPLAPGIAEDRFAFVEPGTAPASDPDVLTRARAHLEAWESRFAPSFTLIEGAGGLHVPMPGRTWQPTWIRELADAILIVARSGLGTINHTLLTLDAAAHLGPPILGVVFSQPDPDPDPSASDNAKIVAAARPTPVLGQLPHGDDAPGLWARVRAAAVSLSR